MSIPQVVSAEEWRAARMDLLAREKDVTRAKDAVDAARRELPVTEVTKDYAFAGPVLCVVEDEHGGVIELEHVLAVKSPARRSRAGLGAQGVAGMVSLSR